MPATGQPSVSPSVCLSVLVSFSNPNHQHNRNPRAEELGEHAPRPWLILPFLVRA